VSTADRGEAGSVTLWLMVMVLAMFAAVGLVFDGGRALAVKGTAISDAYGAARAGAEALDRVSFARGGAPTPDPTVAQAAANAFLAKAGVGAGQAQVAVNPPEVTVIVRLSSPNQILGAVGLASFTLSGTGHARAIYGVRGPQP
jgi:hypothetical protein